MVRFTLLLTSVHFSSMQIFHTAPDPSIPLPQPQSRSGSRRTRAICLSTGSRKPRGRYTPCLAEPDSKCISPREILSPLIQLYHTFVVIGQKQTFLWMLSPQHLPPPPIYIFSVKTAGRYLGLADSLLLQREKNSLLSALFPCNCDEVHRVLLCSRFCPVVKV